MLQFFRNFFRSKIGIGVMMGFLGLIALAFASADVSNTGSFGGVAGGDRVATVGKQRIDASALSQAASSAVDNLRAEQPTASMASFLAAGGLDQVLEQLIDRTAIGEFGRRHGIVASDRLIDSEIAKIAAFKGPDGRFSQDAFRQVIAQRGVSEKLIREDFAQGLIARQVLVPAAFGAVVPQEFALRYAAVLRERREGEVGLIPSASFAPAAAPTPEQLQAFYLKRQESYIRPERRTIRYAVFGDGVLKDIPAPTDAEIAARYEANKAKYAPSETRAFTQVIVPTEAAAKALAAEVSGGTGLEPAARAKGLAAAKLDNAEPRGAVGAGFRRRGRGSLRCRARDRRDTCPLRPRLARPAGRRRDPQAGHDAGTGARRTGCGPEGIKRRAAINDVSARLEEEFDNGATLSDAAKELGVEIATTAPLLATGEVYGKPGETGPAVLGRALGAAFAMEGENQPQVAEVEPGKIFIIFDVARIEVSAPAPLKDIQAEVAAAWMLERGAEAARKAADTVVASVKKGTPLGQAFSALGKPLPRSQGGRSAGLAFRAANTPSSCAGRSAPNWASTDTAIAGVRTADGEAPMPGIENHDAALRLLGQQPALIADTETPVGAAVKLIERRGDFLLESVEGGEVRGRYSLLGLDPDLVFRASGKPAKSTATGGRPRGLRPCPATRSDELRALVAACRIEVPPRCRRALACLVGYFGYETIGWSNACRARRKARSTCPTCCSCAPP
jgi:peptidyl-prolyl cis-trans isomerase D